ncbi:hypothetical protein KNU91_gp101 [Enterococcus phage nattely]|uniref:Uncharacterized protein n=1 Tax=Enterococcus phage nattely TaxID=2719593 RepID=A0A6G9LL72_9CAUD|nr:hypothetical protein KNU91_gp101 [Enterococcus phage nattely]QIQ66268.1 hypothetical protein nattely_101 [Enterococcus phage nattely]
MQENYKYAVNILNAKHESDREWLQKLFDESIPKTKTIFEFDTEEEADEFEKKLNKDGHKTFRNRIIHF